MTQLTKPTLEKQIDALVEMRERFLVMAITYKVGDQFDGDFQSIEDAIESLRELAALTAQQEPTEPVAWMWEEYSFGYDRWDTKTSIHKPNIGQHERSLRPLYTAPLSGVLDKPAQVGNTSFGVGVKISTVIARAQREYEYQNTPEKLAEHKQAFQDWHNAINQQSGVREVMLLKQALPHLKNLSKLSKYTKDGAQKKYDYTPDGLDELIEAITRAADQVNAESTNCGNCPGHNHPDYDCAAPDCLPQSSQQGAVDVDGMKIGEDITLWGIATPVPGTDRHRCLAQVGDVAAIIEIKIRAAQEWKK